MRNDLYHASGWTKKDHKYIRKEGNRYIYPEDVKKVGNRPPSGTARDILSKHGVARVDTTPFGVDKADVPRKEITTDKGGVRKKQVKAYNYIKEDKQGRSGLEYLTNPYNYSDRPYYSSKPNNPGARGTRSQQSKNGLTPSAKTRKIMERSIALNSKAGQSVSNQKSSDYKKISEQHANRNAAANGKVVNPSYTLRDKDGNKIARLQSKDKVSSPNQADYKQYSKERSNEQKRKKAAGNNGRERFFEEGNGFSGNQPSQQSAKWRSSWYKGESIAKKNEQEAKRIKNGKASIPSSAKEAQKLEKRIKDVNNSKSKIPTSDINKINKEVKKAYDKRINKMVERADSNDSTSDSLKKAREVNKEFSKYAESAKPWLKPDSDIRKAHKKSSTSSNANKPVKAPKEYYDALRSNTKNEKEFNDYLDKHNVARPDGSKPTTKNAQKVETWDNSKNIETWDNSKNIKTWDNQTAKKSTKNQKGHFTVSENGETVFVPDDKKTEKRVSKGKQIVNKIKNIFSKKKKQSK